MNGEQVLVMLVEDNIDHAELVLRTLADHNIANQVRHFLDGQSALDYLYQRGEYANSEDSPRPQVILLDLRLPEFHQIHWSFELLLLKTTGPSEMISGIPPQSVALLKPISKSKF